MMLDLILDLIALIAAFGTLFAGYWLGVSVTDRKNRRENAATASCLACGWTSGPVPLGQAFKLAQDHTAMPHADGSTRAIVERAV